MATCKTCTHWEVREGKLNWDGKAEAWVESAQGGCTHPKVSCSSQPDRIACPVYEPSEPDDECSLTRKLEGDGFRRGEGI